VTPADFIAAFPAFKDLPVPTIQAKIDASVPYFDPVRWGDQLNEGVGYWVAHQLVLAGADGYGMDGKSKIAVEANDVTSRDTEHIKISRSPEMIAAQAVDPYMRTVFGQQYRSLSRQIGMGGAAV